MAGTRSSARLAGQGSSTAVSQNKSSPKAPAGTKRKSDSGVSPGPKRGRKTAEKKQQTLEQTLEDPKTDTELEKHVDEKKNDNEPANSSNGASTEQGGKDHPGRPGKGARHSNGAGDGETSTKKNVDVTGDRPNSNESEEKLKGETATAEKQSDATKQEPSKNTVGTGAVQAEDGEVTGVTANGGDSAVEPHKRGGEMPSRMLENGSLYFFFRGRVGIDDPKDVNEIARSYMIMRPLPHGAKLGEGTVGDEGNCRILALPKKVLPTSGKDRFMVFVEKAKTSFQDLKENFLSSSDYTTQTVGVRHTPAVTPVGEGVYAITTTGRESHLAYILTIPSELSEVQKPSAVVNVEAS